MTLVAPWRGDQGASKAIRPDRREENETMNKDEMELTPEKVARTGAFLYDTDDDGQWDVGIDVMLTLDDVVGPTYEDALAVWEAQSAR